jgi:hypothetical protein
MQMLENSMRRDPVRVRGGYASEVLQIDSA